MDESTARVLVVVDALNESPSEKEGKCGRGFLRRRLARPPSMKVPPKRKGNSRPATGLAAHPCSPQ